jgi:hypothetical protein
MSNYGTLQGSFSSFSDNEKLNYSLKIALSRLQTDLKADWFNEPTDFIPKQPLELYKNTIPSYKSVNNFLLIDPDVDGKGKEMVTNKTVGDILSVSSNGSQFTLNDILNTSKVRNPTLYTALKDSDFVDGASKTQIKLLGRNMFTRYKYWTSGLTGKNSLLEGIAKAGGGGSNTGTTPDQEEPFNAYITYTDTGDLSPERRWSVVNGASESSDHKKFYNKLISEGVELNIIDPTLKSDLTKKHPFLKLCLQVPTYTTRGTAPISQNDNNSSSGQVDKTDNIGFHNPLMEKALGDTNGFLSGAGYQIAGWNGSTWKSVTTSYGTPGYQNILYFLSNPGFILIYGQKNIDYGYLTSRSHPPMISFIKYTGETFSDGIISQGETLPAVSLPKDLFINTSDNTIHRYDGSKWVSVGGGSINELSDALVEDNSIYLGNDPSSTTDDAQYNVAVGTTALDAITTGDRNVAMGYNALLKNTTGTQNVAIGHQALKNNTSGGYNFALGEEALVNNTTAKSNTAIGHECMKSNETGNYNTAIGEAAMKDHLSGDNNVVIGREALKDNNIKAENNVVIGVWALKEGTCGDNNVVIGHRAQYDVGPYDNTICLGYNASVTADNMCRIGNYDMKNVETSGTITAGGVTYPNIDGATGQFLKTDGSGILSWATSSINELSDALVIQKSIYLGNPPDAGTLASTAKKNTAIGINSLKSNTSGYTNTACGFETLKSNTTGSENTAVGNMALTVNNGDFNTASGYAALFSNTTGNYNTASGNIALYFNTTGGQNTASGFQALYSNTTGNLNTASGYAALYFNTTGTNNTASGYEALYLNTTGTNNTASGISALHSNTTGKYNTACGVGSLSTNTTGTYNTAIGYNADVEFESDLTNATAIGYNAKVTTSDTIQLGNYNLKNVKTSGTVKINNTAAGVYMYLQVNNDGKAYVVNQSNHDLNLGAKNRLEQLVLKKEGNVEIQNNCFIGVNASDTEKQVLQVKAGGRRLSFGGEGNYTYIKAHEPGKYDNNSFLTITGNRLNLFGNNNTGITVVENGNVQASGNITAGSVTSSGNITAPDSKFGDILIHRTNEINSESHLFLQYNNNKNVAIGNVYPPSYKLDVNGDIHSNGWLRTSGDTGWYSQSHGGGWYMENQSWIRSYGGGGVYISGSTTLGWDGYYWSENSEAFFKGNSSVSLWVRDAIVCDWIGANSDRRIKKNIEDIDDGDALKILRKIPVRYYNYIDEIKKGSEKVAGFIAQEVKEHFPIAVSISPYDRAIPNILKKIKNEVWEEKVNETSKNEWILTNFDVIDLNGVISSIDISSNSKYKFFLNDGKDSKEEEIEVLADTDGSFTFEKKWENLFLYGICIDDFHVVDKNKIFAIGFSATQEIDRIQQVEKQKLEELASKITVAESKIATLEAENILLKSRLDSIEAKLQ